MVRPECWIRLGLVLVLVAACACGARAGCGSFDLQPVVEFNLGTTVGQCRAVPVELGGKKGLFLAWCEDAEIDPYVEMFFFPKHAVKIGVFGLDGDVCSAPPRRVSGAIRP